eukprot:TRINITY_DN1752_c0_g1_i1.p1 TRINITY_DN1752_c0_g1~~TRINITY_DN1752_c0_g1_i1.p1  ORF type:complete len:106 (-),score=20.99 TRINITY_DN1752_c0_g1_i1:161-478(-)
MHSTLEKNNRDHQRTKMNVPPFELTQFLESWIFSEYQKEKFEKIAGEGVPVNFQNFCQNPETADVEEMRLGESSDERCAKIRFSCGRNLQRTWKIHCFRKEHLLT